MPRQNDLASRLNDFSLSMLRIRAQLYAIYTKGIVISERVQFSAPETDREHHPDGIWLLAQTGIELCDRVIAEVDAEIDATDETRRRTRAEPVAVRSHERTVAEA